MCKDVNKHLHGCKHCHLKHKQHCGDVNNISEDVNKHLKEKETCQDVVYISPL